MINEQGNGLNDSLLIASLLVLTFVTGLIDAVSFIALGHVFTANMTGNIVFMAFALGGVAKMSFTRSAVALLSGLAGSMIAGHLDKRLAWQRRNAWLSVSFALEAILMAVVFCLALFYRADTEQEALVFGIIVLSGLAMGIRNGTVRRLGVPELTTTVLTLTVAGLAFDSSIAGGTNPHFVRRVSSIMMMFLGALAGALLLRYSLTLVLGVACFLAAVCAIVTILRNETEHEAKLRLVVKA